MIWFTARMALSSAYLLLEPQPPMNSPTISSEKTGDMLAVDLPEHRIDGAHDRHHVGDLVAGDDVRQHGQVAEGGAAPLQAVRLGPAVGHQVAAELAARALHPRVALAL